MSKATIDMDGKVTTEPKKYKTELVASYVLLGEKKYITYTTESDIEDDIERGLNAMRKTKQFAGNELLKAMKSVKVVIGNEE